MAPRLPAAAGALAPAAPGPERPGGEAARSGNCSVGARGWRRQDPQPRRKGCHQVSMFARFLAVRAWGGGAAAKVVPIQRRLSAGSMTSSISK